MIEKARNPAIPLVLDEVPLLEARGVAPQGHYVLQLGGRAFNPALAFFEGCKMIAWRTGWLSAGIMLAKMTDDYRIIGAQAVEFGGLLPPDMLEAGFEDPRLFVHAARLWIAFTYYCGHPLRMGLARLNSAGQPDECWIFESPGQLAEKNWQFFSHGGSLRAVYSINPQVVGEVSENGFAKLYQQDHGRPWPHGDLRGGTPPIRMGDEYFSFFHDISPAREYRGGFTLSRRCLHFG